MALQLKTKGKPKPEDTDSNAGSAGLGLKPKTKPNNESGSAPASGAFKKGKAAKAALEAERQAAALREKEREHNVFRHFMKPGEEKTLTFLDGNLDEDGDLENICYYEHTVNDPSRKYPKFVCINDPANGVSCPLCEMDNYPYLVTAFTVLNHTPWVSKKDKKEHSGSIRLLAAKMSVADILRKKAVKRDGLTGATFEVTRSNKDAYNVGDDWDYIQKNTLEEIQAAFPDLDVKPLDYEKVIPVHTRDELIALGYGSNTAAVGSEPAADEDDLL